MKNSLFKISTLLLLIVLFASFNAFSQTAETVVGKYWSPNKDGKIEVYKSGDKYFGKFIWGKNPRKDTKNPKAELRSRDIVGLVFLSNFKFDDGEYIGGQIYDPESGKTYSCKMWLENGNLKVRGFVGFSLFGRTETFTKFVD